MVDVDKAVIAKINKDGSNFEILVDCEKAMNFKQGTETNLDNVLATDAIFKDVKKGEHAKNLDKYFGTEDYRKISEIILNEGEVQLTSEYKNKLREGKKRRIIEIIHRNSVDPNTNLPHPIQRIENAIIEVKAGIDEFKSAEDQVKDIITKIREVLPVKYEIREIAVKVPAQFSGQSYTIVKKYGKLLKDEWQDDGSLVVVVETPAGLQNDLYDELNKLTKGDVETKVLQVR
ncbi:ribosome assembly factor SBDS [archaeon]|nr:ribosome assembly factor SBDS [archaeon]